MNDASAKPAATIPAPVLIAFTAEALARCGLPEPDARAVAATMIEADLTGVDTHGIARLAQYMPILREGRINPRPAITVAQRGPATALVDGDNGMGHLVMTFAAKLAVEIAREAGVGWVGSRRSNHAGAAGIYAAIPLAAGMIGLYGAAASANHMAPWGGAEALLGTNPIAAAIPAGEEAPVVVDIATSVSSFGVIRKHALEGRALPEGWVVDPKTGGPVTDAKAAGAGVLLPIGGHKGSGLSLIIGILGGVLNGAAFGRDVREFGGASDKGSNTGQFVVALDIARFMPPETFRAEMDRHIRDLRGSAPLPGFEAVRVPGAERRRRRDQRARDGVPLSAALIKQLDEVAATLAIAPLRTRA
jgi:LDH2 family malate/lactate/ureidoglycolate dehydrogenase